MATKKKTLAAATMGMTSADPAAQEISLGAEIKRARKAQRISVERLAQLVGCSVSTINRMQRDEQSDDPRYLDKIASVLRLVPKLGATGARVASTGGMGTLLGAQVPSGQDMRVILAKVSADEDDPAEIAKELLRTTAPPGASAEWWIHHYLALKKTHGA